MTEPKIVGRIHRVHFQQDDLHHTIRFAEQAAAGCAEDLKGFADPAQRPGMAVLGDDQKEVIEQLRLQLVAALQLAFGPDVDLKAFSFQVAIAEIENGKFFSSFGMVYGSRFRVHQPN